MSDEDLASKARKGDHNAFMELAHRYQHTVFRMSYRFTGTHEDAFDLSQSCLVRAFENLEKYDPHRPFKPWMLKLCSNTCLNWARVQRRTSEDALELDIPSDDCVEEITFRRAESAAIMRAMQELAPDIRLIVVMRFVLGLTLREIAEHTSTKLPTVAFRLGRALDQLRGKLESQGVPE